MSSINREGANTVATLDGHFKEVYASKIRDLVPEGMKMHCKKSEQRYTPWYARDNA